MASISITHVDTCLSCYVLDHCNGDNETLLGVPVDSSSRVWNVIDGVMEELANDERIPDWVSERMIDEAIKDLRNGAHPFKTFDKSLEPNKENSETCFAWFRVTWDDEPDEFTEGYLEAALWSSTDESDPETGGEPMDSNYSISDIAPDAMVAALKDCIEFQELNKRDLALAYRRYKTGSWTPEAKAGHDYWLTRNRHGAGFWDRGLGEVGKRLTAAAHATGGRDLYIGDDNLVHGFGE